MTKEADSKVDKVNVSGEGEVRIRATTGDPPVEFSISRDEVDTWSEKIGKFPILFLLEIQQTLRSPIRQAAINSIYHYGEVTFMTENSKSSLNLTSFRDLGLFEYVLERTCLELGEIKSVKPNDNDNPTVFVLGDVQSKRLLHVTAGISGEWEPTPSEIAELTLMFQNADDSLNDNVVVTRHGVNVSVVK